MDDLVFFCSGRFLTDSQIINIPNPRKKTNLINVMILLLKEVDTTSKNAIICVFYPWLFCCSCQEIRTWV